MGEDPGITYREATARDIEAIAALHADSWRRHYRGSYSDAFLDGDVHADRLATWTQRLEGDEPRPNQITIVAERGNEIIGFAYTSTDDHPKWALLDNLHVRHDLKGHGIGTRLMAETARVLTKHRPESGLHLWVLERNTAAQALYDARGGTCTARESSVPPGGGATVTALRYSWPDPSTLLHAG